MVTKKSQDDGLDEIARLLAIQIKRDCDTQSEAIAALYTAGISPTRIADLLGTTPNTVNVAVSKLKKSTRKDR